MPIKPGNCPLDNVEAQVINCKQAASKLFKLGYIYKTSKYFDKTQFPDSAKRYPAGCFANLDYKPPEVSFNSITDPSMTSDLHSSYNGICKGGT